MMVSNSPRRNKSNLSIRLAGSQDTFNVLRTELDKTLVGKSPSSIEQFISLSLHSDILSLPLPTDLNNIQSIINARRLYDSCINETSIESLGVERILAIINDEFGGWPILQGSTWNVSSFNFSNLLLKLRQYNHNIIVNFATAIDNQNSSNYFIRVSWIPIDWQRNFSFVHRYHKVI